jgi:hypothetical protein
MHQGAQQGRRRQVQQVTFITNKTENPHVSQGLQLDGLGPVRRKESKSSIFRGAA